LKTETLVKELVLLGGGHSHVVVLKMLAMNPIPGLQVTLISPEYRTPYSGMLPGLVAGHYSEDDIHIDLVPLARFAGVRFLEDRVISLDTTGRRVITERHPPLNYDVLSIDIGITPSLTGVEDEADVIAVKPISEFLQKWRRFQQEVRAERAGDIAFVGGGAGGVELCFAVHQYLQAQLQNTTIHRVPRLHLVADSETPLTSHNNSVQQSVLHHLSQRDIQFHRDFRVVKVLDKTLISTREQRLQMDAIFWITQASAQPWLAESGLDVDDTGFVLTTDTLQSINHPEIFAVGDTGHVSKYPRPKAGVFAVRQGKPLYENIKRFVLGKKTKGFKPQKHFLSLVTTGGQYAIASRGAYKLEGGWVWLWKNWIDRRFMSRFSELPEMIPAPKNGLLAEVNDQMRCAGCGSKVSSDILTEVLRELGEQDANTTVTMGINQMDDAAVVEITPGKALIQTVDAFRSFIDDPFVFARISVLHAVSDIYAMGAEPKTALMQVSLPYANPQVMKSNLRQLMAGTLHQLHAEGITLIGGHTNEAAELSLGFTINGEGDKTALMTKAGLRQGDKLILTKSLGSGALFAADMQYRAKGNWINDALKMMLRSNGDAARIARQFSASACTDVTGFGLAGHLYEMLTASGKNATLSLAALPLLAGTREVLQNMKITSTLHASNRQITRVIARPYATDKHCYEVLFDPQTSGGLLIAVNENDAVPCVTALRQAGYQDAGIVGEVTQESMEPVIEVSG